ncbi:MAG: serine/threonine protein kinase [Myxococcota bacterium]
MSDFFDELTPDRVLSAVEQGGYRTTGHCSPLTCLENRVYDVRLESGAHVVAKFYRPNRWTRAGILDEHRFLADLQAAEIPVCAPLSFPDGETLHSVRDIHYALWERVGGRSPDEFDDEQIAVLGRLLARIHNVGAAGSAEHRARLEPGASALAPLAFLEDGGFLPHTCRRRYRAAVEAIAAQYEAQSEGVPVHRIHGDCHVGNLLRGDAGWFFLDFDDFVTGPAVHDVWMLLPGRDPEAARQRTLLIESYRQFRDFDLRWLELVEPLRAFRFIFYAAWIAKRWRDRAFPAAFPHFGTPEYWENETRDLEELVARVTGGGGNTVEAASGERAAPGEPELTNQDFFWDL